MEWPQGYDTETPIPSKVLIPATRKDTEYEMRRFVTWTQVERCGECGGPEIGRFKDVSNDRYHVFCHNIPPDIQERLDEQQSAVRTSKKRSAMAKRSTSFDRNSLGTPTRTSSGRRKSSNNNRIRDACGWHVSF